MQELNQKITKSRFAGDRPSARQIQRLLMGLRAITATYWLDVSLTQDDICWYFGNFGEPNLVTETEPGLHVFGLDELADCFSQAKGLMTLFNETRQIREDLFELLERHGLSSEGEKTARAVVAAARGHRRVGRSSPRQASYGQSFGRKCPSYLGNSPLKRPRSDRGYPRSPAEAKSRRSRSERISRYPKRLDCTAVGRPRSVGRSMKATPPE